MSLDHRRNIRLAELQAVLPALPRSGRLLEIGAGAGWQAKALAEAGFEVTALDVKFDHPSYNALRAARVWPVKEYDGVTIPYPDKFFDVVFSSNTLPHVPDLARALSETRRVMKDDGLAVHVLPTVTWRIWTLLAHFVNFRIVMLGFRVLRERMVASNSTPAGATHERRGRGKKQSAMALMRKVLPTRLGERGNVLSEILLFSERKWAQVFAANGLVVDTIFSCGVYYTGHHLLGSRLFVNVRKKIAVTAGSSCKAFLLSKPPSFLEAR